MLIPDEVPYEEHYCSKSKYKCPWLSHSKISQGGIHRLRRAERLGIHLL
jgi:hypothetical protein